VIALHNNIPLGELYMNPDKLSPEQYESTKPILEKFVFYDHFGSLQSDKLFNTLRYMALGLGVDFIFLDHISIVVSGLETHDNVSFWILS
jgi:twinkle protein